MSTNFGVVGKYQKVKKDKEYNWPCDKFPDRKIEIYTDDVLKRTSNGIFTKVTGICCVNINIPEEDIIEVEDNKKHLIML